MGRVDPIRDRPRSGATDVSAGRPGRRRGDDAALVSVAVVDGGGHLVAFERMDGAEIAGPVLARDKAFTAVAHRVATAELTALVAPGAELAGMNSADGGALHRVRRRPAAVGR